MKKSGMLEYSKMILEKVSFDTQLFLKELQKAVDWLYEQEVRELETWLFSNFRNQMDNVSAPLLKLKS